ncbi:hypothetical protein BUALT_Bualt03G0137500 [Buddleja alternifolia]|uniref:Phytocyanin domain-containing protein n=1 Tax=Buddleja alternifolia TaxID=168488 RepID=A0AAV6XV56_9LAMI|nr:hypothetical protein BUALT_Bualt03G0137500 [Buddleja alternifolia]
MANNQNCVYLFLVIFSAFAYSSFAYQLIVGGKDGWVPKPSESYNHWAERLRFNVNDTLLFKYKKGSDSVLVVNKDDYEKCNTENPILKLDDGNSIFKFNRSGPFYFISGNNSNCGEGQKIHIVVLAVRNRRAPPSPIAPPPSGSPPSPGDAPAPASSPAEAPAPEAYGPAINSSAPESDAPADDNAAGSPPRRSSATSAFTPAAALVSTVSVVLSVGFGGFIVFY